jgi:hypothetical protein
MMYGAGIGAGSATPEFVHAATSFVETILIQSATITTEAMYGAAIGGGVINSPTSSAYVDRVEIADSVIEAMTSFHGAGIGCGWINSPDRATAAVINSLTIRDSAVEAWSADDAAIGSRWNPDLVPYIKLSNVLGFILRAPDIVIGGGYVLLDRAAISAHISQPPLFGNIPTVADEFEMIVVYDAKTQRIAENLPHVPGLVCIQFGTIHLPIDYWWDGVVWSSTYSKVFSIDTRRSHSILFVVPVPGAYTVAFSVGDMSGRLGNETYFVKEASLFVPEAWYAAKGSQTPSLTKPRTGNPPISRTPSPWPSKTRSPTATISASSPIPTVSHPTWTGATQSPFRTPLASATPRSSQGGDAPLSPHSTSERTAVPTGAELSAGTIFAITVASFFSVIIASLVVVFFFMRKRRAQRHERSSESLARTGEGEKLVPGVLTESND